MNIPAPSFSESFNLLRTDIATGAHDQDIVAEFPLSFGGDLLSAPVDVDDVGNDEVNAGVDEFSFAPADFLWRMMSKGRNR